MPPFLSCEMYVIRTRGQGLGGIKNISGHLHANKRLSSDVLMLAYALWCVEMLASLRLTVMRIWNERHNTFYPIVIVKRKTVWLRFSGYTLLNLSCPSDGPKFRLSEFLYDGYFFNARKCHVHHCYDFYVVITSYLYLYATIWESSKFFLCYIIILFKFL